MSLTRLSRRAAMTAAIGLGAIASLAAQAADRYPAAPVTLVTHWSPGGGDVFLREMLPYRFFELLRSQKGEMIHGHG
jgi:tripartite-type tricarboxylate transporter receptor subunit TctC